MFKKAVCCLLKPEAHRKTKGRGRLRRRGGDRIPLPEFPPRIHLKKPDSVSAPERVLPCPLHAHFPHKPPPHRVLMGFGHISQHMGHRPTPGIGPEGKEQGENPGIAKHFLNMRKGHGKGHHAALGKIADLRRGVAWKRRFHRGIRADKRHAPGVSRKKFPFPVQDQSPGCGKGNGTEDVGPG